VKKLIEALLDDKTVYDFRLNIRETILKIIGLKFTNIYDLHIRQPSYSGTFTQRKIFIPQRIFEGVHGKSIGMTEDDKNYSAQGKAQVLV